MASIVGVFLLCLAAFGCSPVDRHKVLTLLFDGVPPFKEKVTVETSKNETIPAIDQQDSVDNAALKPLRTKVQHGPYAAKMCDGCHNTSASGGNRLASFTLKAERHKLCLFCHEDKRPEVLAANFSWVHGPVQYGECLTCHNPHESAYNYMLKIWPTKKQCLFCHDEERLLRTETHADTGESDCVDCHNAHAQ